MWREVISQLLRSTKAQVSTAITLATGGYVANRDRRRFADMMAIYDSGNVLPPHDNTRCVTNYFPRPELEQKLEGILTSVPSNEYYLVYGEVGSGKTRSITETVRKMAGKNGQKGAPIYVNATQGKSFPESLASAVGFKFDEHISLRFFVDVVMRVQALPRKSDSQRLCRTLDAIEKSACLYLAETGRPAVIVIDSVNTLQKVRPDDLQKLQDKAKLWADTNIVKMVFVSNDEQTEAELHNNTTAWPRTAPPVYVGDLSPEDALCLLVSGEIPSGDVPSRGVMSVEQARKIVDLVGGRLHLLLAFKRGHVKSVSFEETARELRSRESDKLMRLAKDLHKWKVVETLQKAPQMTMKLSQLRAMTDADAVHTLLRGNVIRVVRPDDERRLVVKFASRLTEHVVTELLS